MLTFELYLVSTKKSEEKHPNMDPKGRVVKFSTCEIF